MTKREAELEALARFAAAGKVKKLSPCVEAKVVDLDTGKLTYTLEEKGRGPKINTVGLRAHVHIRGHE